MPGAVDYVPARGSDPANVVIHAYYGESVPDDDLDWFRDAFPHAQVRLVGPE